MDVWKVINDHLMSGPALKSERLPTFYPSSASTYNEEDGSVIGACLRMNYYRCAGYSASDPPGIWSQYVFAGGKIWEQWLIDQLKESGVFLAANLKFVDIDRWISGEVDCVIQDPDTGKKIVLEMKTFYGYDAKKRLCGNTKVKPAPKDPNLLQAFLYLDQFKDEIDTVILMYFARDDHSRAQFIITQEKIGDKTYPRVTTQYQGQEYTYVDKRITLEGIYARYEELKEALAKRELPTADFKHTTNDEDVERLWNAGEISKTAYEKWQSNKVANPIGHFMCRSYCDYRSMCKAHKAESGEE